MRKGSESGTGKLERAFWSCLEKNPYDRMTVSEVVREAGVNRALFYYHFNSLASLAEYAVTRAVPLEVAHGILLQGLDVAEIVMRMSKIEGSAERMRRLRLVAGSHGTAALVNVVKGSIRNEWLHIYGLEEEDVDDATHVTICFVLGGVMSMWADSSFEDIQSLQRALASSGMVPTVVSVLRSRLSNLAAGQP